MFITENGTGLQRHLGRKTSKRDKRKEKGIAVRELKTMLKKKRWISRESEEEWGA